MINTIQMMNIIKLNTVRTNKYKRDSEGSLRNINSSNQEARIDSPT